MLDFIGKLILILAFLKDSIEGNQSKLLELEETVDAQAETIELLKNQISNSNEKLEETVNAQAETNELLKKLISNLCEQLVQIKEDKRIRETKETEIVTISELADDVDALRKKFEGFDIPEIVDHINILVDTVNNNKTKSEKLIFGLAENVGTELGKVNKRQEMLEKILSIYIKL